MVKNNFVVAEFNRTTCNLHGSVLDRVGLLRLYAIATRRGTKGISKSQTRLNPFLGLLAYIAERNFAMYRGEAFRYKLYPIFDSWAKTLLRPGDNLLSVLGQVNESFKWVKAHGGRTFIDAVSSHPESFWSLLKEEQKIWKSRYPPILPDQHRRALAMLEHTDYVFAPSKFVEDSFLSRGFNPERVFRLPYPIDLSLFKPNLEPRTINKPLTVINTGSLSLRKGTPYLLEAFRIIKKKEPGAKFLLTRQIRDEVKSIIEEYSDLRIEWSGGLPHGKLVQRLRSADIFVLPSLEEGFVRTALEALAAGLPIIVTPNTGVNDFVVSRENGEVVPIRNPLAIAEAVLKWWDKIRSAPVLPVINFNSDLLSFKNFEDKFLGYLKRIAGLNL